MSFTIEQLYKVYYETNIQYSFCCLCPSEYFSKTYTYDDDYDTITEKLIIDAYSRMKKHNYKVDSYCARIVCSRDIQPSFYTDEIVCVYMIDTEFFRVSDSLNNEFDGRCVYIFMKK